MKSIIAIALAIISTFCFSEQVLEAQLDSSGWKESRFPDSFHQHIAAAGLLADHYCINKAWPRSIEELQIFAKENQREEANLIDWPLFLPPRGKLIFDAGITLITPAGDEPTETLTTSSLVITECTDVNKPKIILKIDAKPHDKKYKVRSKMQIPIHP